MLRKRGGKLYLAIREWECTNCGSHYDHDINARKNILVLLLLS
ncbi:zinc ribbon domain-containing protein [Dapis sp. BLCC M172]